MKFKAKTDDNRKLKVNWDLIETYCQKWQPGTYLTIEITRKQSKKSDPMRKYYFAVVLPTFMEYLGYEPDEEMLFHRQLKITYFRIKPDKKGIYRKVPSVFSNESEVVVGDKKKFVDWVVRKAAQEGAYVPDPE